jgi:hypothetical protein
MADPIIVDHFRAMAILRGISGLPEDVYVNNFVFRNDQLGGGAEGMIRDNITSFYGEVHAPGTGAIKDVIPANTVSPGLEVRVYDLGEPAPREPTIFEVPMTWSASAQNMPTEVAVCASYYADRNLPRQRGRIYIGPLIHGSGNFSDGALRPADSVRANIAAACRWLSQNQNQQTWCVLSRAAAAAYPITAGWVDDAFDTQRRRGAAPTTRDVWETS